MIAESAWKQREDTTIRTEIVEDKNCKLLIEEMRDLQSAEIANATADMKVSLTIF